MKQPIYTVIPEDNDFMLSEQYIDTLLFKDLKLLIKISRGFIWDGMSIPAIARTTTGCPGSPKHALPGLIHDWLYRRRRSFENGELVTRKQADQIMLQLLEENGESWYNRNKMYRIVRIVGGKHWKK